MSSSIDPQIVCPKCQAPIKLTESLAAPLIAATRAEYENRLKVQNQTVERDRLELQKKETELTNAKANFDQEIETRLHLERLALKDKAAKLERAQATVEEQVVTRLQTERTSLLADQEQRIRTKIDFEMRQLGGQVTDLETRLKERNEKLQEAQKVQASYLAKQRELEDKERELDLTVEKKLAAASEEIRVRAKTEVEAAERLKLAEKDQVIAGMQSKLEEAQRKAEQGSQQMQGEVLELDFETRLRQKFPHDRIEPVPKGELGADIIQHVITPDGKTLGKIIWELKRTKNWSDGWLTKLKEDLRNSGSDLAVIVTAVLPKHVDLIGMIEEIHVVDPRVSLALAVVLRQTMFEVARVKIVSEGQATKTEQIYAYLTGPRFKNRMDAAIENFSAEQTELDKEKKFMNRQWAKREQHLQQVLESLTGLYGDLQGIAGSSMQSIAALDALEFDGKDE